jgi:hypothetical protein
MLFIVTKSEDDTGCFMYKYSLKKSDDFFGTLYVTEGKVQNFHHHIRA